MKDFFNSIACRSGAHCRTCRDLEGGRAWRMRVKGSIAEADWTCPKRKPWGYVPPAGRKPVSFPNQSTPYHAARMRILAMPPDTDKAKFLKAMLAQGEQLIYEGRGGSCREKRAYRKRLQDKLVMLWNQHGQPSVDPA
jgi:hypothetical protein